MFASTAASSVSSSAAIMNGYDSMGHTVIEFLSPFSSSARCTSASSSSATVNGHMNGQLNRQHTLCQIAGGADCAHSTSPTSASPYTNDGSSFSYKSGTWIRNLIQQETELLKNHQSNNRGKCRIASSLHSDSYRLHLKLNISDGNYNCTLVSVSINPPESFLDRLLTDSSAFYREGFHMNSDTNFGANCAKSALSRISSRIAIVAINCNKALALNCNSNTAYGNMDNNNNNTANKTNNNCIYNRNTTNNETTTTNNNNDTTTTTNSSNSNSSYSALTEVAQNGFSHHGQRYHFLLSKDPTDKIAYFLRSDLSNSFFPDATTLRNFIADFSSQPSVSKAGMIYVNLLPLC